MRTTSIDIGHLLDSGHGSSYQRRLVLLTAVTIVFDGIDNQLIGIAVPTMMREWALQRSAFAPVISIGYLGMMTGGAAAGLAGARFGCRRGRAGSDKAVSVNLARRYRLDAGYPP